MPQNYYFSANQNAKRLHGGPTNGYVWMYSPSTQEGSNIMRKQNNKQKQRKQPKKQTTTPRTPFKDVGGIVGRSLGGMFGQADIGRNVGKWLGTGIGSIFGSGDYVMSNSAEYNIFTNNNQIPKFSTTKQTNVVCHREFLGSITGATAFTNRSYPLNPGLSSSFPWLSSIASQYQEYRIHGMIFEFRPLITDYVLNGAPGVVVMATNYNANDPLYVSRQQIENTEYATSVKPTVGLIHGIECAADFTANPIKYVRSGAVGTEDLRLYDMGNFQFVSQNNPAQDLGELWVSYCVEFFKPTISEEIDTVTASHHTFFTGATTASPMGTVSFINVGNLLVTARTGTSMSFTAIAGQTYYVSYNWTGTGAGVAYTAPTLAVTNATPQTYMNLDTVTSFSAPQATLAGTINGCKNVFIKATTTTSNPTVTLALSGGTLPDSSLDLVITEVSNRIIA